MKEVAEVVVTILLLIHLINFSMKTKKISISDDPRWEEQRRLKKVGLIIESTKLKNQILDSYKWKKPCHHVSGEINK